MTYVRMAHNLQMLAMSFVAAQKDVDGICHVMLLVINY